MEVALRLARAGSQRDLKEVPVGSLCVSVDGIIVSTGVNSMKQSCDPTSHAEILALRRAARVLGSERLPSLVLVSTLEPCLMCVGASVLARVDGIVYGARSEKTGALESRAADVLQGANHRPWVLGGVLEHECGELLREFFRHRRSGNLADS